MKTVISVYLNLAPTSLNVHHLLKVRRLNRKIKKIINKNIVKYLMKFVGSGNCNLLEWLPFKQCLTLLPSHSSDTFIY